MCKFIFILAAIGAVHGNFDFQKFQRIYCYNDTNIRTTAFYIPYKTNKAKEIENGFVCEKFKLSKTDLDSMAKMFFSFSKKMKIVFKDCKIDYLNENLISKFPNINQLEVHNCNISLSKGESSGNLKYLGFHQCNIFNNNDVGFQQFSALSSILIQNSTLQYPLKNATFLKELKDLESLILDQVNVKSFPSGFSKALPKLTQFACTSCDLEEFDSASYDQSYMSLFSFANNNLKKLPTSMDILSKFQRLRELDLSNNQIVEPMLHRIHFKSLKNLLELNLSWNKGIGGVSPSIFKDISLQKLNMSNVKLKILNKLGCSSLKNIDFSYNEISTVPSDVFESLNNLEILNLGQNNIFYLDNVVFKDLGSLKELYLDFNSIHQLHTKIFENLVNLRVLNLSYNFLKSINGLENLKNLNSLHLQHNQLEIIPSGRFLSNSLHFLDISGNTLLFIGRNTFENLSNLTEIDLSNTSTSNLIDFDDKSFLPLKSLKTLIMKFNNILSLDQLYLPPTLEHLDLQGNAISTIKNEHLENLSKLQELNLVNNRIENFEKDLFRKFSNIIKIDLDGNKIYHNKLRR